MYNVEINPGTTLDTRIPPPPPARPQPLPPPPIPYGVLIVAAQHRPDDALTVAIRALPTRLRLVGSADSAAAALNLARALRPSVVLLDGCLLDRSIAAAEHDFLKLLRALIEAGPRVVVLDADQHHQDDQHAPAATLAARALQLGAHAVIPRSRPATEVAIAIAAAAQAGIAN
jgi:DNA-binding NarL/FixJ family response regulator